MLFASDMDGTVIPLDQVASRTQEIAELKNTIDASTSFRLAYISGRDLQLALQGIESFSLPEPEFIVGDVGTSLYRHTAGKWHQDMLYRETLRELWKGLSADQIVAQLGSLKSIKLQEQERQSEFKASYYCSVKLLKTDIAEQIKYQLNEIGQQANVICSIDPIAKQGLIDILPPGVAKDFAVRFLQKLLTLPDQDIIYAGDSGNDLAVFLSGYKSIIVGNTPDSVKLQVKQVAAKEGFTDQLYFAEQSYAAGVLEGLRAFDWVA